MRISRRFVVVSLLAVVAMLGALAGLSSCTNKPSDNDLVFITVDDAQRLAAGQRSLLGGSRVAVYIDARSTADFDAGHIPGAISLPFERVSQDYYMVKDRTMVIVYGADYNDARANAMSKRLKQLVKGLDVRTLDGGVRVDRRGQLT